MSKNKKDIYEKAGVSYKTMDPVKKLAQNQAKSTAKNLLNLKEKELEQSRGESAYVYDCGDHYRALVMEGLGTKSLVADEMEMLTGKSYYKQIAQDTVATIINDLITVGAKPEVLNAFFAVGDNSWFENTSKAKDLIIGWKRACNLSGCAWGGGETETLKGIINSKAIDLAGTATGVIKPKSNLILGEKLKEGDLIILIESSGIHANGLTLARKIAKKLKKGFATKMPSGKIFGDAILKPTIIYAKFLNKLQDNNVDIHYASNITGHGWRKIMRSSKKFTYQIEQIPAPQEEFLFMQKHGKISDEEAYGNFNMGAGFALFIKPEDFPKLKKIASSQKIKIFNAGFVKKGPKQVIIKPKNITYKSETLDLR